MQTIRMIVTAALLAVLAPLAACNGLAGETTTGTTRTSMGPVSTVPGQPVGVVSVISPDEGPTVVPAGPLVEITLKNVSQTDIISLDLVMDEGGPHRRFSFAFGVSRSHPFQPGTTISAGQRLIGGGFGGGPPYGDFPYSLSINGTLESGETFAFTWRPPDAGPQSLDYLGQWSYQFPDGLEETGFEYDRDAGLIDAIATCTANIDGEDYLVLSFDAVSSKHNSMIFIFDVQDPLSPALVSSLAVPAGEKTSYHVRSMDIRDGILYAGMFGDKGLWAVDISNPEKPVDLGIFDVETNDCVNAFGEGYLLSSGQLYHGITICNVSDLQHVYETARIDLPSRDVCLDVHGSLLFTGIGRTLNVYDISEPAMPEQVGSLELDVPDALSTDLDVATPGPAPWKDWVHINDIQASGDYVYVTYGAGQVQVIDVSDPASPEQAAMVDTRGFTAVLTLDGNYLYVTTAGAETYKTSLVVVDVTDPLHPVTVASAPMETDFILGGVTFAYCWTPPQIIGDSVYVAGRNYFDVFKIDR